LTEHRSAGPSSRIKNDESTSDSSFRGVGLAVVVAEVAASLMPYRWNLTTDLHGTKVKITVVQMHQIFRVEKDQTWTS
jgi:hypothetical protein